MTDDKAEPSVLREVAFSFGVGGPRLRGPCAPLPCRAILPYGGNVLSPPLWGLVLDSLAIIADS